MSSWKVNEYVGDVGAICLTNVDRQKLKPLKDYVRVMLYQDLSTMHFRPLQDTPIRILCLRVTCMR